MKIQFQILVQKLFSNISFQFLGGAVSGAAIVALLNQFFRKSKFKQGVKMALPFIAGLALEL